MASRIPRPAAGEIRRRRAYRVIPGAISSMGITTRADAGESAPCEPGVYRQDIKRILRHRNVDVLALYVILVLEREIARWREV